jgi:DNA-binding XRE family transcriptional regulator
MKLRELRDSKDGLSIVEQTLMNWEDGTYEPDLSDAVKLAKVYGVSLEALVSGNTDGITKDGDSKAV